jgi:hypothetical protein
MKCSAYFIGAEPISLGLCSKNNPRNIKNMPVVIFFACLDLERKSSLINRLIYHEILGLNYRTERLDWQENFKDTTWVIKKRNKQYRI